MNIKELVKKFGGQSVLAERLGIGQSAIAYWVKKNAIPSKWHAQLLALAGELGVDILAADFDENESSISVAPQSPSGASIPNGAKQFLFYAAANGTLKIQVLLGDETVWASQKGMAEIFDITVSGINQHLKNIFKSKELDESTVIKKNLIRLDNDAHDWVMFYNLDAIISVGYRVNSYKATQFRRWATTILKEYLVKGFAMDDERLKQGNQLFGKEYFDELLERIREIRTSERMFWQKVTDLYSQCSSDYDKDSPITGQFFAQIQNKFHYAIHRHTAAELIKERADSKKPNMGLVHFANMNKDGVVLKSDIVGKNFLSVDELDELDRVVENYLGTAELFAKRKIVMTMKDWVQKLDEFLRFNAYEVLDGFGLISSDAAKQHAFEEYEKFKAKHDKEFRSDFDKLVTDAKTKRKLPKAS